MVHVFSLFIYSYKTIYYPIYFKILNWDNWKDFLIYNFINKNKILWQFSNPLILRTSLCLDSGKFATENEGNCLQFFELQSVGNEALRKLLDGMSGTFQMKWAKFEQFCRQKKFLNRKYSSLNLFRFIYVNLLFLTCWYMYHTWFSPLWFLGTSSAGLWLCEILTFTISEESKSKSIGVSQKTLIMMSRKLESHFKTQI